MFDRRDFLKTLGVSGVSMMGLRGLNIGSTFESYAQPADDPWAQVPKILALIKPPVFPKRDFNVLNFGAVANGNADSTDAFRKAIEACNRGGGGRVVVPAGVFSTGAI